uniref:Uncharacterized protein n=1 Tax=Arundo donax TaxID=35708 RepID=A0A0A9DVK0_ARUDO
MFPLDQDKCSTSGHCGGGKLEPTGHLSLGSST